MKEIYIGLVKLFSTIYKNRNPRKVIYLMSFSGNEEFILKLNDVLKKKNISFEVLSLNSYKRSADKLADKGVKVTFFADGLSFLLNHLKKIMESKLLICDNYYAFLAGCNFDHDKTHIVQIWHANGAIKTFGWEEPRTQQRSKADKKRFQKVYNQFDEYIVGSNKMATVFANSYHEPLTKMNVIGYPRTDELFDQSWRLNTRKDIYQKYPELMKKEVILYAPTYREDKNGKPILNLPTNFNKLFDYLSEDQRIIIKLHPHLKEQELKLKEEIKNTNVVWINDFKTNDLLLVTDRLVTDYSSIIFDYSLLKNAKQMLFFCYDLKEYQKEVGIQSDFEEWIPGKLVNTTVELINHLKSPITQTDFTEFNKKWNTCNDGSSTQRVIENERKYFE